MKKILQKIRAFLLEPDKLLHIIAGLIVSAWFTIVWPMEIPIVAAIAAGILKEFVDKWRYGRWDWADLLATVIGGAVIQVMVLL